MMTERLLFVDDDPIARRAFARVLRQRGFIVDVAKDAEEAWELANQFPYAVVATDYEMPGSNGFRLIDQLGKLKSNPSCLLVSGVASSEEFKRDKGLRTIPIIRKPWNGDELVQVLSEVLDDYRARRTVERLESEAPMGACGTRVVIVDSDSGRASRIKTYLDADPKTLYEVKAFSSLAAVEAFLDKNRVEVALVTLGLGDLDPRELTVRFAGHTDMAVLVLGDDTDEADGEAAVRAGAQDFIPDSELSTVVLRRVIGFALERKRSEEQLLFAAHHDSLTKLANRALLEERLNQAIVRARRKQNWVGVLFLDLDRFKAINDSLGHEVGDQLLTQVAKRLYGSVRELDTVARLSGDEFAIILEDVKNQDMVTSLAQRLLNSFATPFQLGEHEVVTTTSIGIALWPDNGVDTEQLLKSADTAMNRAKETGRNNYQFYGEGLHQRAMRRLQLETELRHAIDAEQFIIHYQPQVDLATNEICGVEALLRWKRDGEPNLVSPLEFIPVLEETGMIVAVGDWVLRKACRDIEHLNALGYDNLRISVNVSAVQFEDDDFLESVRQVVSRWGLPANLLELEITEGVLMRDGERTQQALKALSEMGVRIAVDDFGTGYCTLLTLKRFRIDTLKIDRSFVKDLPASEEDATIASAVVALGKSLGMEVVAEGVEDDEQRGWLADRGCHYMQGYFVSRPVPLAEFMDLLGSWGAPPSRRSA